MPLSQMDKIIPLYDAVQQHRLMYDSGDTDYSVTTLLNPPRVVHLNKRYAHKIDLYVQDLLYSFTGTAMHEYLEKMLKLAYPDEDIYKMEERLRMVLLDRKISGAFDILRNRKTFYDMKNTSCWKVVKGGKDEWMWQQNMYRYMYWKEYGVEVDDLRIIGVFRDWSKANMFKGGPKYPRHPAVEYRLPIQPYQDTLDFMTDSVKRLKAEEETPDDDLPLCTFEDMWADPDTYAVKSTRIKRAVRVLSSRTAANNFIAKYLANPNCKDKIDMLSIEKRPAERKRCESWCPANVYCNQFQDYLKAKALEGA